MCDYKQNRSADRHQLSGVTTSNYRLSGVKELTYRYRSFSGSCFRLQISLVLPHVVPLNVNVCSLFFTNRLYENASCVVAGLTADANLLVNHARLSAQRYLYQYGEHMPVEQLVKRVCDYKQVRREMSRLRFDCKCGTDLYTLILLLAPVPRNAPPT